ncbi:ESX secretion-associated protein EspG [Longimycelium tulufanense]|uniref:ESX secretion-associated protein EspG n=1 Tax=Longimycelium tulufanense TaxID=907463 RepID=A0A8J3CKI7_9PSEU|nr:ESX secretion-associated protein EspG [Longimycelium tulufanense]GGM82403.1 ESX secretion-associated protein EspG [Longimycelium tulufanense]
MLRASVALSTLAFDVLWQHHEFGEKPNALYTPSPGATHEERGVLEQQVWGELAHHGLIHRGRVDEDLLDTLALLARPGEEVYGWINHATGADVSVLAATLGSNAVLALLSEGVVQLRPVRVTAVVDAVVAVLPQVPSARGPSLTLPADQLDTPRTGPSRWFEDVRPASAEEHRRLHHVLALPRTSGAQLHVAVRDRSGRRRRARYPLTVLDTTEGRWMSQLRPATQGHPWVVLAPVHARLLSARLREMRTYLIHGR